MEAPKSIRDTPKTSLEWQISSRCKDALQKIVSKSHVTIVEARNPTSKLCFMTHWIDFGASIEWKTSPLSTEVKIFSQDWVTCRKPCSERFVDRDPLSRNPTLTLLYVSGVAVCQSYLNLYTHYVINIFYYYFNMLNIYYCIQLFHTCFLKSSLYL